MDTWLSNGKIRKCFLPHQIVTAPQNMLKEIVNISSGDYSSTIACSHVNKPRDLLYTSQIVMSLHNRFVVSIYCCAYTRGQIQYSLPL